MRIGIINSTANQGKYCKNNALGVSALATRYVSIKKLITGSKRRIEGGQTFSRGTQGGFGGGLGGGLSGGLAGESVL